LEYDPASVRRKIRLSVIRAIGRQADRLASGSLFDVEIQPAIPAPIG
jgi:hypothetical protein